MVEFGTVVEPMPTEGEVRSCGIAVRRSGVNADPEPDQHTPTPASTICLRLLGQTYDRYKNMYHDKWTGTDRYYDSHSDYHTINISKGSKVSSSGSSSSGSGLVGIWCSVKRIVCQLAGGSKSVPIRVPMRLLFLLFCCLLCATLVALLVYKLILSGFLDPDVVSTPLLSISTPYAYMCIYFMMLCYFLSS
jgi:hypothetical protein